MTTKGFLSTGEHIDDVMMRVLRGIDEVLGSETGNLTIPEREAIFKDLSITFKEAEVF
jgi:hypothetical protein